MNAALLVLLVLVATAGCRPVCKMSMHHSFRHMASELFRNSSVAPWTFKTDEEEGRYPQKIQIAECSECKVPNMTAKPILLSVLVYISDKNNNCKTSSFEMAVGCTCVSQQQQ